jgi:hypothetical protein
VIGKETNVRINVMKISTGLELEARSQLSSGWKIAKIIISLIIFEFTPKGWIQPNGLPKPIGSNHSYPKVPKTMKTTPSSNNFLHPTSIK